MCIFLIDTSYILCIYTVCRINNVSITFFTVFRGDEQLRSAMGGTIVSIHSISHHVNFIYDHFNWFYCTLIFGYVVCRPRGSWSLLFLVCHFPRDGLVRVQKVSTLHTVCLFFTQCVALHKVRSFNSTYVLSGSNVVAV